MPQWFEPRANLPEEDIEAQFKQDFGHYRSIAAIQAMLYHLGAGHLRRKKKNKFRHKLHTSQSFAIEIAVPVLANESSASSNTGTSWVTAGSCIKERLVRRNTSGSCRNGQINERLNDCTDTSDNVSDFCDLPFHDAQRPISLTNDHIKIPQSLGHLLSGSQKSETVI